MDDLNEIYSFRSKAAPGAQDAGCITRLLEEFKAFLRGGDEDDSVDASTEAPRPPSEEWSEPDLKQQAFLRMKAATASYSDLIRVQWLPEYGCCLLTTSDDTAEDAGPEQRFSLLLLALDKWEFHIHNNYSSSQHTALCSDYRLLSVGDVRGFLSHEVLMKKFWEELKRSEAGAQSGNRSATHGTKRRKTKNGNQKTPAFIRHLLHDIVHGHGAATVVSYCGSRVHGGFTDVGMHTGTMRRSTVWPLAEAFIRFVLQTLKLPSIPPSMALHPALLPVQIELLLALFHLHQAEYAALELTRSRSYSKGSIDRVVLMLTVATQIAAELCKNNQNVFFDWSTLLHRCQAVRTKLALHMSQRVEAVAQEAFTSAAATHPHGHSIHILPAAECRASLENLLSLEQLRNRAQLYLNDVPLFSTAAAPILQANTLSQLHHWMITTSGRVPSNDLFARLVILSTVEQWFYAAATQLGPDANVLSLFLDEARLLSFTDSIEAVVVLYGRMVSELYFAAGTVLPRMRAEMRSRELLVVWISFCLVHKAIDCTLHTLSAFNAPLDWRDLRHLVLSSRPAIDAAVNCVAEYIKRYSLKTDRKLFYLSEQSATMEFAKEQASRNIRICSALRNERIHEKQQIAEHWEKVCEKKAEASRLRQYIADTNSAIDALPAPSSRYNDYAELLSRSAQLNSLNQKKSLLQSQLKVALQAPPAVLLLLPSGDDAAYTVLFFCYMPKYYQTLGYLSVAAQQMLFPHRFNFSEIDHRGAEILTARALVGSGVFNWIAHFSSCKGNVAPPISLRSGLFTLEFASPAPLSVGPSSVDDMHYELDGVWYPDSHVPPTIKWNGGDKKYPMKPSYLGSRYFDPFRSDDRLTALDFAEPLPDAPSLNWTVPQLGFDQTDDTRGNQSIAIQDHSQVPWLNKPAYLEFTALRAFPMQQLRKVCIALSNSDILLPLEQPAVQTLLQQALYHIGELSSDSPTILLWKQDQTKGDGLCMLEYELRALSERLAETPKDHEQLLIAAEIAAYAAQWSNSCRQVARDLSQSAFQWAEDIDNLLATDSSGDFAIIAADRCKQCLFYLYSIVGHSYGEWTLADAVIIVRSRMKCAYYGSLNIDSSVASRVEASLSVRISCIMSVRVAELALLVAGNSALLTAAVREIIQSAPLQLQWRRLDEVSTCFDAQSNDGHLYSVNIATGALLFDGLPLKRLPDSIRNNTLFKRCFGDCSFEVQVLHGVIFQTARPIEGCYYRFQLAAGESLLVEEIPVHSDESGLPDENERMRLLDPEASSNWCSDLPPRLQQLCSHWISSDGNHIALRPRWHLHRRVLFLFAQCELAYSGAAVGDSPTGWECYRMPANDRTQCPDWKQLLDRTHTFDRLRRFHQSQSALFKILSDFEQHEFIHAYLTPDHQLQFHLPRFDLEFQTCSSSDIAGTRCLKFPGSLCAMQQLSSTGWLPTFQRFLLLTDNCSIQSTFKALVPKGDILYKDSSEGLRIISSSSCDANLHYYVYELHPRFQLLRASSVEARLYLAALHTASSSLLPLSVIGKTEFEVAISLVRQSWVNRPLHKDELKNLQQVVKYAVGCPTLQLLCCELNESSKELSFLFDKSSNSSTVNFSSADALMQYHNRSSEQNWNFYLTEYEELRLAANTSFRRTASATQFSSAQRQGDYRTFNVLDRGFVEHVEKDMLHLTVKEGVNSLPFPIEQSHSVVCSKFGEKLMADLKQSWDTHCNLPRYRLCKDRDLLREWLLMRRVETSTFRVSIETHLLQYVSQLPVFPIQIQNAPVAAFQLARVANDAPTASIYDLCRLLIDPSVLPSLNPFLNDASAAAVREDVVLWLKLCVLEDKCVRLLRLCAAAGDATSSEARIVQELRVTRIWDASEHPQWLLFEMEGAIQIRPLQYAFAEFLLHNPGAISQLNMGEGKTRVVLPMLMLHWAASGAQDIFRLHFLTQLLQEAHAYLHLNLTASVHQLKLILKPFHRQIEITPSRAHIVRRWLYERCLQQRCCLLIAPEHRLSLDLKWYESRLQNDGQETAHDDNGRLCTVLDAIHHLPYRDVLDESDELLRYKYQLIYSTGQKLELPDADSRYIVPASLLNVLQSSSRVRVLLNRPHVAVCSESHSLDSKQFQLVRLIPGPALDDVWPAICVALMEDVLDSPPHEMQWLRISKFVAIHFAIKRFVVDTTYPLSQLLADHGSVISTDSKAMGALLALRGYLAHGLLFHVLQKRHRVNYGITRSHYAGKRMAVPFRAHDTPSERSQYGHPDTEIALSYLSYYYDGLSPAEVLDCFNTLLKMNPTAQRAIYQHWFDISRADLEVARLADAIDSVDKIDLSNERQKLVLVEHYRCNRHAISFWLASCVFPTETKQYATKLMASAWHLASNTRGQVVGMSGTNDSVLLYPLQVKQELIPGDYAAELHATNGNMLGVLTRGEVRYIPLDASNQRVLEQCISMEASVLIDAGAMCSDMTNDAMAGWLLASAAFQQKHNAVVFFDSEGEKDWVVRDIHGHQWLLHSSPIKERDCFVIIDEVRCRGTDMKLKPDAVGLLTLSLGMTKDKLMQAAARMRMLTLGLQSVHLTGFPDVTASICVANRIVIGDVNEITAQHVLQWVLPNTVRYNEEGLKEWDFQGQYFCNTNREPELAHINDVQQLVELYGQTGEKKTVCEVHDIVARRFENQTQIGAAAVAVVDASSESTSATLQQQLKEHVTIYGFDCEVMMSLADDECEKEAEKEKEVEREVEPQLQTYSPRRETCWDPSALLNGSISEISSISGLQVFTLSELLARFCSVDLHLDHIVWSDAVDCYCTENFAFALQLSVQQQLENYLRPLDAMLYFPTTRSVLLLSEREADRVLAHMWKQPASSRASALFMNLAYAAASIGGSSLRKQLLRSRPAYCAVVGSMPSICAPLNVSSVSFFTGSVSTVVTIPATICAALQLSNGAATFNAEELRSALRQLLQSVPAQRAAMHLCVMRGLRFMFPRSDVEAICREAIESSSSSIDIAL